MGPSVLTSSWWYDNTPSRYLLVQTAALDSVIKQYVTIKETMHKVHQATRDEYGLKEGGVLAAMENFTTLFGLRLGHLFGAP